MDISDSNIWNLLFSIFAVFIIYISLVSINDIAHIPEDNISKPFRPFPAGILNKKSVLIISITVITIFLFISLFKNILLLIPFFLGVLCGLLYAFFKESPFFSLVLRGLVSIAGIVWLYMYNGGMVLQQRFIPFWAAILGAGCLEIVGNLFGQQMDIDADISAGIKTLAVHHGKKIIYILATLILFLALFLFYIVENNYFFSLFLVLIFVLHTVLFKKVGIYLYHKLFRVFIQPSIIFFLSFIVLGINVLLSLFLLLVINVLSGLMLYFYDTGNKYLIKRYNG